MVLRSNSFLSVREKWAPVLFRLLLVVLVILGISLLSHDLAFAQDGAKELEDAVEKAQKSAASVVGKGIVAALVITIGAGIICQILPFHSLKQHAGKIWFGLLGVFFLYVVLTIFSTPIQNAVQGFTTNWQSLFGL